MRVFTVFCLSVIASFLISTEGFSSTEGGEYQPPLYPLCTFSYRFDSFGRGIEAGFFAEDLKPELLDTVCYKLGVERGKKLTVTYELNRAQCEGDFNSGRKEGLKWSSYASGNECYIAGYNAGLAALNVGAREANVELVGLKCVAAYKRGKQDSEKNLAVEASTNSVETNCYMTGYNDGQIFRSL